MEKEQLDSLATVAVGSEKIPPPPHSHYAPSEVYSSSESPPAYSRPSMKSTAVQITRIIAATLIAISVIIGSFILAGAWLQARASCTPESLAAMQAQMSFQQHGELLRRLQPEALIQEQPEAKESLQTLDVTTATKETQPDTKDIKIQKDENDNSKADNESGDENENDEDYDDPEFTPVDIKLPLQLDLDDLANTLMQQAKNLVSCVVERRRSDEFSDGNNNIDNSNIDKSKLHRLSGERVSIICESGDHRRQEQQQEQERPIIFPLGPMQMPMQPQEQDYHRYHLQNQYPIPENQRPQFMNPRNVIHGMVPPRNIPQMMEMSPPQMRPQVPLVQRPIEIRPIPIELRQIPIEMIRRMRPPMNQERQQHVFHHEQAVPVYHQEQQTQDMMPPPPPPPPQQPHPSIQQVPQEHRIIPQMMIQAQMEQRVPQSQETQERSSGFPFQEIPSEIRRIFQQVPSEIKNIIQHITGEVRAVPVPEGARREQVQDFKPFPEVREISLDSPILPIGIRNFLEHGNTGGRQQEDSDEQQEPPKPFQIQTQSGPEDQTEEEEKRITADVKNLMDQIGEGRAFHVQRFSMPIRPIESVGVPMEVSARVMSVQGNEENKEHQEQPEHPEPQEQQNQDQPQEEQQVPQQAHVINVQPENQEENRPHYVQPRSVRSISEESAHPRDKRLL